MSRTSKLSERARASSSARIPIPAIRGRIGSGARTATRSITTFLLRRSSPRSSRQSPPPAEAVEEEVQLPGPGVVDLLEDAVQALDLDVGVGQESVVLVVAGVGLR